MSLIKFKIKLDHCNKKRNCVSLKAEKHGIKPSKKQFPHHVHRVIKKRVSKNSWSL